MHVVKLSAALLALTLMAPVLTAPPATAEELSRTELTPSQATAAAEELLEALEQREGAIVHNALADAIRASVSKESVQARLDQRVRINAGRIVGVSPGYNTTTVDAVVTTADGDQALLMVLDDDGKLLAWKWADKIKPIESTALDFARDLAAGRWVIARSKMSLELQKDLSPQDLERKWNKLSRVSGGFRKVKDAVIAHQGGEQQLVLVAVAFANTTSNLFVIFDERGRIINVDISRDFV